MAVEFAGDYNRTAEYRMYPEDIKINAELNGRHELPDIEWLIASIVKQGQHTPVVIRKDGGDATLVAGFSRWRAVNEINKRNLLGTKIQVRCTYQKCNEQTGFLVNISENRDRKPTTQLDDAHNIQRLLNVYAMTEEQVVKTYFPVAQTESELKEARTYVAECIALLSLTPEAEKAVRSGRVKASATKAIAKLSSEAQTELLKKNEGKKIARKDVKPPRPEQPRAPKGIQKDAELMRRLWAVFEEIEGILTPDNQNEYIEVDRVAAFNLLEYVRGLREGTITPAVATA